MGSGREGVVGRGRDPNEEALDPVAADLLRIQVLRRPGPQDFDLLPFACPQGETSMTLFWQDRRAGATSMGFDSGFKSGVSKALILIRNL